MGVFFYMRARGKGDLPEEDPYDDYDDTDDAAGGDDELNDWGR